MFRTGRVEFTTESKPVVDALARFLVAALADKDLEVTVEGHSDAGGDEAENVRLSTARAEALCNALGRRGVTRDRLHAVGVGSARPLVGPGHPEEYRNRRVELFLRPARPAQAAPSNEPPAVTEVAPPPPSFALLDDPAPVMAMFSDEPRPRIALLDDEPAVFIPLLDDGDDLLPPKFSFSLDLLE